MKTTPYALTLIGAMLLTLTATAGPPPAGTRVKTPHLSRLILTVRTTAKELSDSNKPGSPFYQAASQYLHAAKRAKTAKNPAVHSARYVAAKQRFQKLLAAYDAKARTMHAALRELNREAKKYAFNARQNVVFVHANDEVKASAADWTVIRRKATAFLASYASLDSKMSGRHKKATGSFQTRVLEFERVTARYVRLAAKLRPLVQRKDTAAVAALYPQVEAAQRAALDVWTELQKRLDVVFGTPAEARFRSVEATFKKHYRGGLDLMATASGMKRSARRVSPSKNKKVVLMRPKGFRRPAKKNPILNRLRSKSTL